MRKPLLLLSFLLLPSSLAFPAPPSANYKLVFADEFRGNTLDTYKWNYNYTWGQTHNHRAYVTPEQVIVSQDRLNLQAIAQRHPNAPATASSGGQTYSLDYTSGAVNTSGKLNIQYGYIEARIRMSDVVGTWPAFWTLGNGSWPATGEIDIMEFPRGPSNSVTQYWANYHYTNSSNAHASYGWQNSGPNFTTQWNTFGVEWTPSAMRFYLNGSNIRTITDTAAIADATPQYLILNQAVGGWPGNPTSNAGFPSNYEIDWVRVHQLLPSGATSASTWKTSGNGSWDTATNWTGAVPRYGDHSVTFPRVGAAPSATVTWSNSRTVGNLTFTGDATGTTIYVLGSPASALQLANGSGATITAAASSTASHAINARLELYNSTTITNQMTSGSTLNLNGNIIGTGTLSIDGPGTVVIASPNNAYTGGTVLNPNSQGPAVLRVSADHALGTGTVIIGPIGNATTARLELYGSRTLANPVDLRGRNNDSVAIQSTRGDNVLAGTLTLGVGGDRYRIHADAGTTLALTHPTSLNSLATGPRNVTLQGPGNGRITGAVTDGNATLSLTKSGPGTWTLSGPNDYTGLTIVAGGTLVLAPAAWSPALTGAGTDLQSGTLVFDYAATPSPIPAVRAALASGTLRSTTASPTQSLAYTDSNSTLTLLLAPTGDLNLDGVLSADDYALLDRSVALSLTDATWTDGDLNYDGQITSADYLLLDTAYLSSKAQGWQSLGSSFLSMRESQFGPDYVSQLLTTIPEPTTPLLSTLCFLLSYPLLPRRHRR